jgi:hypothetical protein
MISKHFVAEGLMSQLADAIIPSYDSTGKDLDTVIGELLDFQRSSNPITKGTIEPTWEDLSGWISPTSTADPSSGWTNDNNAIDGNEVTWANTSSEIAQYAWSEFLELHHVGVVSNKIKVVFGWSASATSGMDINLDAEWDGGWHDIYTGAISGGAVGGTASIEKDLNYTKTVTGIRAKFYNGSSASNTYFYFREGYIWGVEGGKLEVTNQSLLWSLLQLYDIVGSGFIYVDNDRVFHWLNDIGEDKGQQIRYRKNLEGITKETDWGSLCTRLFPIGNEVALSDLTVVKEAATKSSDASYGYLTLTSLYSCYNDWTGEGDAKPSHILVYKDDVLNNVWEQGEDEHTLRCDIGDYDAGATYTVTYKRADYLIAWDVVATHGILDSSWTNKNIGTVGTLLELGRLELTNRKTPPITYKISAADLSRFDGFDFEALQLGSIVTVIDEELGIDVSVRVTKIIHPDLLAAPHRMELELSNKVKNITDALADMYRQFG